MQQLVALIMYLHVKCVQVSWDTPSDVAGAIFCFIDLLALYFAIGGRLKNSLLFVHDRKTFNIYMYVRIICHVGWWHFINKCCIQIHVKLFLFIEILQLCLGLGFGDAMLTSVCWISFSSVIITFAFWEFMNWCNWICNSAGGVYIFAMDIFYTDC